MTRFPEKAGAAIAAAFTAKLKPQPTCAVCGGLKRRAVCERPGGCSCPEGAACEWARSVPCGCADE